MKSARDHLEENRTLPRSVRVLTGTTNSGKRAIYVSGTADGLRLLADLIKAQADAPANQFTKLERQAEDLFFTTDDSVDILEVHTTSHIPENHAVAKA